MCLTISIHSLEEQGWGGLSRCLQILQNLKENIFQQQILYWKHSDTRWKWENKEKYSWLKACRWSNYLVDRYQSCCWFIGSNILQMILYHIALVQLIDSEDIKLPGCGLGVWMAINSESKTLPKAQRTLGLSSYYKITVHSSQISTKYKVKILTKPRIRILTKIQLRNLNQTSGAKYWPNFSFKISPDIQLQNLDQSAQSLNKS